MSRGHAARVLHLGPDWSRLPDNELQALGFVVVTDELSDAHEAFSDRRDLTSETRR